MIPQGIFPLSRDRSSMKQKAIQLSAVFSSHRAAVTEGLIKARVGGSDLLKRYYTNTGVTLLFYMYPWRWVVKAHTNPECDKRDQSWGEVCLLDVSNSQSWEREDLRFHSKNGSQVCYLCKRSTFNRLKFLTHDETWKIQEHHVLQYSAMTFKLEAYKTKKNPLRATDTMFVHSYTAQIQPN